MKFNNLKIDLTIKLNTLRQLFLFLFLFSLIAQAKPKSTQENSKSFQKSNKSINSIKIYQPVKLANEKSWSLEKYNINMNPRPSFISKKVSNYSITNYLQSSLISIERPKYMTEKENLKRPPYIPFSSNQFNFALHLDDKKIISTLENSKLNLKDEKQMHLENPHYFSDDELKLTQGLILTQSLSKKEISLSVFLDLMQNSRDKTINEIAQYFYATTLFQLALFSEYKIQMIDLLQKAKQSSVKIEIISHLLSHIEYVDLNDIPILNKKIEELTQSDALKSNELKLNSLYWLKKAKWSAKQNDLDAYSFALNQIKSDDAEFSEAQLLFAILKYKIGEIEQAFNLLKDNFQDIQKSENSEMKNLASLTLARLYFQKSDYPEAIKYYDMVNKKSEFWLESLTELAWSQILLKDYEGAAGNMFSVQIDYFKKIYSPESYILRTIAYLNLCQYGDALHVLSDLNHKYDSFTKIKLPDHSYEIIKDYFQNPKQKLALPTPLILELIKHPEFIRTQKMINNLEDETAKYDELLLKIIKLEKEAKISLTQLKTEVYKAEINQSSKLNDLKKHLSQQNLEITIYNKSKELFKNQRNEMISRNEKNKTKFKQDLDKTLKAKLEKVQSQLVKFMEQKEVLSYEIYSGAGEQLRAQLAQNDQINTTMTTTEVEKNNSETDKTKKIKKEDNRLPSHVEKTLHYSWKHQGELWEDEIGYYRSSLINICQQ